jgi:hypothetical protein
MATTANTVDNRRETVSLIGSDKVEALNSQTAMEGCLGGWGMAARWFNKRGAGKWFQLIKPLRHLPFPLGGRAQGAGDYWYVISGIAPSAGEITKNYFQLRHRGALRFALTLFRACLAMRNGGRRL